MNTNYFNEHTVYEQNYAMISLELIDNPKYSSITNDAKIAYALLVNRSLLSVKKHFIKDNKAYIFFPREEMMKKLNCSEKKAIAVFRELREVDLIEEVRQGVKKANIIFVKMPETSNIDTDKTKAKIKQKKSALENKKQFLKKLNTSIKIKNNILTNLKEVLSKTKDEVTLIKQSQKDITSSVVSNIHSQIDYDYFTTNNYKLHLVDVLVSALSQMKTSPQTKIGATYYNADELSPIIDKVDDLVALEFVEYIETKSIHKVKNLTAYFKTAIFNFVHDREVLLNSSLDTPLKSSKDTFAGYDLNWLDEFWNTVPTLA